MTPTALNLTSSSLGLGLGVGLGLALWLGLEKLPHLFLLFIESQT